MEEVKVGEYIRTKYGNIDKVVEISEAGSGLRFFGERLEHEIITLEGDFRVIKVDIVKHSQNIIDLIEVGDYVNGYPILGIENVYEKESKAFTVYKFIDTEYKKIWNNEDIKSIVTKEQFKNVEYNGEIDL